MTTPISTPIGLLKKWESIDLLFQLTEEASVTIPILRSTSETAALTIRECIYKSYLFFAIKLNGNHYTITLEQTLRDYARNQQAVQTMPAMILFQHGKRLPSP